MRQLRDLLDDPEAGPCGRCDVCTGSSRAIDLPAELVREATEFLRGGTIEIEPRKRWASTAEEHAPSGSIPIEERLEPGRALSVYGDGAWGDVVRDVKYHGEPPNELFPAVLGLIARWDPDPSPAWVTYVPSRSGTLSRDLAHAVADGLGLPLVDILTRAAERPPQKDMDNSSQQMGNVYGALEVTSPVPAGPVLLVDDIADSRWTLTVVGATLRRAGSGPVFPLVLAMAVSS